MHQTAEPCPAHPPSAGPDSYCSLLCFSAEHCGSHTSLRPHCSQQVTTEKADRQDLGIVTKPRAADCPRLSQLPPLRVWDPLFDIFGPITEMRMKVFRNCGQLKSALLSTSRSQGLVAAQRGIWRPKFGCIIEGHPVWLTHVPYGMPKPREGRGPEGGHTAS